jgi:hypothetical protein
MATLITAYRRSGLGLRRFAQEQGISPSRLHYWIYQKSRASRPKSSPAPAKSVPASLFQEVKRRPGAALLESWAAEVKLTSGVSVRFSGTANPGWMEAVLQALQRPC